ncbi:MAG: hypothetical protein PVH37_17580 [Desulfobacterales bacterium]|jgi:hypothetical protein
MNDKLIKTIVLGNGLILEIYDYSKKVAGDRWLVKMVAKVDISIDYLADNAFESSKLNLQVGELKKIFDTCVRYEHQRERNFISEKEKDEVFNDLLTSYLESTQAYLSHPDFPIRYVAREYSKKKQQSTWYPRGNSG